MSHVTSVNPLIIMFPAVFQPNFPDDYAHRFFFKSSPEDMFIDFGERGRVREKEKETM